MPRVLGELGGGTVFADTVVLTRDGRSVLEPAPLGPLLEAEVQRLRQFVADLDAGFARSPHELNASMTPQAVAARRARREERWKSETRDPVALDAAQVRLASLDAAGQRTAACGGVDAEFLAHHAERFELLAGAPADCVPTVQVRRDLVDSRRATSEVQLLTVGFGEILCGLPVASGQTPQRGTCEQAVPLLRDLDWGAVRRAIGW
jgi:hypothetical protein